MALVKILSEKLSLTAWKPTFTHLSGFLDERLSDLTVNVTFMNFETCSYKLHRNVLCGCSKVLHQALVNSDTNKLQQTLDITFMSPAEFELLIMFFYTGDVHFKSVSELCTGLYAASMYQLDNLHSTCTTELRKKLEEDSENSLLILQMDERFNCLANNKLLFDQLNKLIERDYRKILSSGMIEELASETLKHLLQMQNFQINCAVPEIEVFRTLLRWTTAQCRKNQIEQVGENLQKMAGDLIYLIRYNLIPVDILAKEISPSRLLTDKLVVLILEKCYNDTIEVPFCTQSRGFQIPETSIKHSDIVAEDKDEGASYQFESNCTLEKHVVTQTSRWSTVNTISWNKEDVYFSLPAAATTNTRWEVKFNVCSDDFAIYLRCASLDKQFRAASVRLFAVLEDHPHMWTEAAIVLKSGEEFTWYKWSNWGVFSNKLSKHALVYPLKVRVHTQWTELDQLLSGRDLWKECASHLRFRWRLNNWKIVTPTSIWGWCLYSETFGERGALWRIVVQNCSNRQVIVYVQLQHLPASVNWLELSWNCALTSWGQQFDEQKKKMVENSSCQWTVVKNIDLELQNSLDLNVVIHVLCDDMLM